MGAGARKIVIIGSMVLVAALFRLLPHPPNVAPVVGLSLLSGATLGPSLTGLAVPVVAMLVSDAALELLTGQGFHANMPVVYGTLLLVVVMGRALRSHRRLLPVATLSLAGSTVFYLTTNLAVWAFGTMYPHTLPGLLACYAAALPFFGLSILGDLAFSLLLFGSYAFLERRYAALAAS